jgi:general stress protein YciG
MTPYESFCRKTNTELLAKECLAHGRAFAMVRGSHEGDEAMATSGSGKEPPKGTSKRGFASMDAAKQREIARKGGRSVPAEKRSFSRSPELAAEAGRKGGNNVPQERRSFSQDRTLAVAAGRKGGISSKKKKKKKKKLIE